MKPSTEPPLVIASARVMSYANVEDIAYKKYGKLYVEDKLIEEVPNLAICINLAGNDEALLYHCDSNWEVVAVNGGPTIEESKIRVEKNYPGVGSRWIDINVTQEQGLEYYENEITDLKCSFCSKRPFEIKGGWAEGENAVICYECVDLFYKSIHDER